MYFSYLGGVNSSTQQLSNSSVWQTDVLLCNVILDVLSIYENTSHREITWRWEQSGYRANSMKEQINELYLNPKRIFNKCSLL